MLWFSTTSCLLAMTLPVLHHIHPSHYTSPKHPAYLFLSCITMCDYSLFCSPVYYLSIGSMRPQKVQLSLPIIVSLKSGPCKMSDKLRLRIYLFQNFRNSNLGKSNLKINRFIAYRNPQSLKILI